VPANDSLPATTSHTPQSPFRNNLIDVISLCLLFVDSVVLHRRCHPVALHSSDVFGRKRSCQQRIPREALKIPASERGSMDAHSWCHEDCCAFSQCLLTQCIAYAKRKLFAEGSSEGNRGGKTSSWYAVRRNGASCAIGAVCDLSLLVANPEPISKILSPNSLLQLGYSISVSHTCPRSCLLQSE
jgi:hypothetical protein